MENFFRDQVKKPLEKNDRQAIKIIPDGRQILNFQLSAPVYSSFIMIYYNFFKIDYRIAIAIKYYLFTDKFVIFQSYLDCQSEEIFMLVEKCDKLLKICMDVNYFWIEGMVPGLQTLSREFWHP